MPRTGNRPNRRISASDQFGADVRSELVTRLVYVGSGHHKRFPANYGFQPPTSPRPTKSLCDGDRIILKDEAVSLFKAGIVKGMFSNFLHTPDADMPKYVWSVDANGKPYEAINGLGGYHGYRLEEEDPMAKLVVNEWKKR